MSGLIIMGGPMSVNDDDDWITQEIQLIQHAIDNNLPVLGMIREPEHQIQAMTNLPLSKPQRRYRT